MLFILVKDLFNADFQQQQQQVLIIIIIIIIIIILTYRNLMAYDKDQFSDPYVRMYLLPDRSDKSKKKTEVMKNNLNPAWEES